jgi:hypothetical protein
VNNEYFTTNTSEKNITVSIRVSGNASAWIVAVHPDTNNYTSPQQITDSTADFENTTLEVGQNEIYAITNTSAGAISISPSIYVLLSTDLLPITNNTLRIDYAGCTNIVGSQLCYASEAAGTVYVGIAKESSEAIAAGSVQTDTSRNTLKIYATRPFDTSRIAGQLSDDEFLDRVNPLFGYERGASSYILRNELRYNDIYLGGDFRMPAGTYQLYLIKKGVDTQGRNNLTIMIR